MQNQNDTIKLQRCISGALLDAEAKFESRALYLPEDMPEDGIAEDGQDAETIYTIASCFSQDTEIEDENLNEEVEERILVELKKRYPHYIEYP